MAAGPGGCHMAAGPGGCHMAAGPGVVYRCFVLGPSRRRLPLLLVLRGGRRERRPGSNPVTREGPPVAGPGGLKRPAGFR